MIDRSALIEASYRMLDPQGVEPSEDLSKEAFLAPLGANLMRLLGLGVKAAPAAEAAAGAVAKPGLLKNLGSMVGLGGGEGTWAYRLGKPLSIIPGIGGREGAASAIGWGGLGGLIGAAMPGEGESRWESALKGLGMGTLGGIGWEMGARGFDKALGRFVKPTSTFGKAKELGWGDIWNRSSGANFPKLLGAKSVMGLGGFGAGLAGQMGIEHLYHKGFGPKVEGAHPEFEMPKTLSAPKIFGATSGSIPSGVQGGYEG